MDLSLTERAVRLALVAHEGQKDWGGFPFILHPMRVGMTLFNQYDERHACIGILHDSIEDSEGRVTQASIATELGAEIAFHVAVLTRVKGQEYGEYLDQVAQHKLATRVKLADLADNLAPFRLMCGDYKQQQALKRHGQALHELRDIARGHGWI